MPPLPLWCDKGTILPVYDWQDFPIASDSSSTLAKITFEAFKDDGQIYPSEIRRYCLFRRKWLTPDIMTEEAFMLWPQPEPYIAWTKVAREAVNVGFIQYIWQCRVLPSRNEQAYYVNIQEM